MVQEIVGSRIAEVDAKKMSIAAKMTTGLKPLPNPSDLRGPEGPLFHGDANVLVDADILVFFCPSPKTMPGYEPAYSWRSW